MQEGFQMCMRCRGRKELYRLGNTSVYSFANTGGKLVTCPMCNGIGSIKSVKSTEDIATLILNTDKKEEDILVIEVKDDDKGKTEQAQSRDRKAQKETGQKSLKTGK